MKTFNLSTVFFVVKIVALAISTITSWRETSTTRLELERVHSTTDPHVLALQHTVRGMADQFSKVFSSSDCQWCRYTVSGTAYTEVRLVLNSISLSLFWGWNDFDPVHDDLEFASPLVAKQNTKGVHASRIKCCSTHWATKRMSGEAIDGKLNLCPLVGLGLKFKLVRERCTPIGQVKIERVFAAVTLHAHDDYVSSP